MSTPIPEESKVSYRFLGRSGLKVSNIALGCADFGKTQYGWPGQLDEDLAHQVLNRYAEWGGNFVDTANYYGYGGSETIIGKWLDTQPRDKFVIASKCRMDMGVKDNVNNVGLSRRHITESIDNSLRRLHTDFVDLYHTHVFDDATPLEETYRTLDDLVRVGKVRYVGVSNVTGWQLQKIVDITKMLGLNPIVSLQQQYNLLSRYSELEPFQVCKSEGIGVMAWAPLKGGVLSGKVQRGVRPTQGRLGWVASDVSRASEPAPLWSAFGDQGFDVIETAENIAKAHNRQVSHVALRWLLQRDVVSSVIIGVENLAELDNNLAAASGWSLTKEEMKQLDEVSSIPPPYPYESVFRLNSDRVNPAANDFYVSSTSD